MEKSFIKRYNIWTKLEVGKIIMEEEIRNTKQKRISIALTIVSIFVEIIACLIWLAPVSGFFIYPFVSGFAVALNIISLIISRKNKAIVIINGLISIVLVGLIAYDLIFCVRFFIGF